MSHIATVDYEHISFQCNSICELASKRLAELDEMIEQVDSTTKTLKNHQTDQFKRELIEKRTDLDKRIKSLLAKSSKVAKLGIGYENRNSYDIINEANSLHDISNDLASNKIIQYRSLFQELLKDKLNESYLERLNGGIPKHIEETIEEIDDAVLKNFMLIAYLANQTLEGKDLINEGKKLMNYRLKLTYEEREKIEKDKIRAELEAAKVDSNVISKIVDKKANDSESLKNMRTSASKEIVSEEVRRKSLNIIVKAIKSRGYIVEKKNVKIDREKNVVNFSAMKASGERADFKIFLDGKFVYDFHHGYKGMACQKDIEPFLSDLEEIYGMKIKKETEIWSNPDKISTMKYQQMKYNEDKR